MESISGHNLGMIWQGAYAIHNLPKTSTAGARFWPILLAPIILAWPTDTARALRFLFVSRRAA